MTIEPMSPERHARLALVAEALVDRGATDRRDVAFVIAQIAFDVLEPASEVSQMQAMFDRAGIVYEARSGDDENKIEIYGKTGPKNTGFRESFAEFRFDGRGALQQVELGE